eukprot:s2774_g5.t1
MKAALFVVSPNGQQQCAGEYVMQSETANGQPVWEQKAGFFWLYSGTNGMWIIGAKDAKDKNFKCSHGLIFCPANGQTLWTPLGLPLCGRHFLPAGTLQHAVPL